MKKIIALLAAMLLLLSACSSATLDNAGKELEDALTNMSDANNKYVLMVKGGYRVSDPSVTYDDAFSAFFGTPRWKYFKSEDGQDVVEFTGDCMYQEVAVKARIQFVVDEENGTFEATYLAFNEVPQNALTLAALISKAFEEAAPAVAESDAVTGNHNEPHQNEPAQTEPPQNGPPANPGPSDFVGTWVDATSTYQMEITYADSRYSITVTQNLSNSEWNQWNLEGAYEQNFGIFCLGTYVEQYLRDDGTVGLNSLIDDVDDVIYFEDGLLHWDDSVLGFPEILFTRQ